MPDEIVQQIKERMRLDRAFRYDLFASDLDPFSWRQKRQARWGQDRES